MVCHSTADERTDMGRLEGKRVLVTGAGSGLGQAMAVRFAQEGAHIALLDIDREGLTATVAAAGDAETQVCVTDVTREDEVEAATAVATHRWGGLDVVVANAAVQLFGQDAPVHRLERAVWDRTLAVNLTGVFLTCKHGIRALLDQGGGSVVCTASPTSLNGSAAGFDAYTASKAGVLGLVRVMANDYAAHGVRVNALIPGFSDTPLVRAVMADEDAREQLLRTIPLGRPARPDEIASMAVFLASDESSYATGGAFPVDGGLTAV